MKTANIKIGIICGSGFYGMEELTDKREVEVTTEFGDPSDKLLLGKIGNVECVFLSRHGKNHRFNPTDVNYRANIRALQKQGVTHVLAATACGSLQEELEPGHFVIMDSFIDQTRHRESSFHDQSDRGPDFGTVSHIAMSPSFCEKTRQVLISTAKDLGMSDMLHNRGTAITIEGPRFSSKAESILFKSWNCDVINMTTVPEVCLAAEAGLSYASVAMVTDYDCWREGEEAVDVPKVMALMKKNVVNAKKLLVQTILNMEKQDGWDKVIEKNKARVKASCF